SVLLDKIKAGARAGRYRLVYFDEAGFAASPPVQYGWSPRGKPHETEPQHHDRRSVLGALQPAFILSSCLQPRAESD
ncbi:hypothetical protein, partial [Xenorhabdus bovienii]|uniref:hypothetical protein n=1 Tax=Xenorhabdus bovienii TaxID=40576 RepID=UPI00215841CD